MTTTDMYDAYDVHITPPDSETKAKSRLVMAQHPDAENVPAMNLSTQDLAGPAVLPNGNVQTDGKPEPDHRERSTFPKVNPPEEFLKDIAQRLDNLRANLPENTPQAVDTFLIGTLNQASRQARLEAYILEDTPSKGIPAEYLGHLAQTAAAALLWAEILDPDDSRRTPTEDALLEPHWEGKNPEPREELAQQTNPYSHEIVDLHIASAEEWANRQEPTATLRRQLKRSLIRLAADAFVAAQDEARR